MSSSLANDPIPQASFQPAAELSDMLRTQLDQVYAQLAPDDKEFVGREFLIQELEQFIGSANRMQVLVGPPGVGKTAFAAHLVETHLEQQPPFLAHFCSLPDGEDPLVFCSKLANQIRALLGPDYVLPETINGKKINVQIDVEEASPQAQIIGLQIKNLNLGSLHPREAFRSLIREPLQAYHSKFGGLPNRKPLVIVIDAIDRSWQWDGGQGANIVSLLLDAQDLPPWVNILCTARPGTAVQALRSRAGVIVYALEPQAPPNQDDIARFLRERFIAQLDDAARSRLLALITPRFSLLPSGQSADPQQVIERFVAQVVQASEGNFSYVRRYVGSWRMALRPAVEQPPIDASTLLDVSNSSLIQALQASYKAIYDQMRPALELVQGDADDEVLGTLALAYEPLSYEQIRLFSRWTGTSDALKDSLTRLAPVLTITGTPEQPRIALYHSGFAEYVRQTLSTAGRTHDLDIAQVLEHSLESPELNAYAIRHRWEHVLRGLQLVTRPMDAAAPTEAANLPNLNWRIGLERVREVAPDVISQAQLLRVLAEQALSPSEADVPGSWSAALGYLSAAEQLLSGSTAVKRALHRPTQAADAAPEVLELGRTLIALGDAYRIIAQRMDTGSRLFQASAGYRNPLFALWDGIVRLPLGLFLLVVLVVQGVREFYLPGTIQNLGRGQDWSIARLYVLSVSAYRRANGLMRRQDTPMLSYEIAERLGRTYMLMGAYDAAAATYDSLLSQTVTLTTPWYQAVWQLARGEVELAQRHPERAIEMLNKALLVFKAQQSPVPQARALSALASAYALQAELSNARGVTEQPIDQVNQALQSASEAIAAWKQITSLDDDESVMIDPNLSISQIGNLLWSLARQKYVSAQQGEQAEALRDSITERHFPQIFEHPLLRLFRVMATIFLPAILLLGLLLAVQRPSTFLVNTNFDLAFAPPLLDLSTFPNALIDSAGARPSNLSANDLSQIVVGSGWSQLTPAPPQLRPPTLSLIGAAWLGLQLLVGYYIVYLLLGLAVLWVAAPEHHQQRRPGRLILKGNSIIWSGPRALGLQRETVRWLAQEARGLAGSIRQRILDALGDLPTDRNISPLRGGFEILLTDILQVIVLDRRADRWPLGDFSFTQLILRPSAARFSALTSIYIPGSLAYYDELCDELARRFRGRWRRFSVELVRSLSGLLFLVVLFFSLLLAVLTIFQQTILQTALPLLGYSLNDLYILVAPGLLLPLLWWFVIQPLAARVVRGAAVIPLSMATMVGAILVTATVIDGERLNILGIQPDIVTPILALGILMAIVISAPQRPLSSLLSTPRTIARGLLAALAFLAMFILIVHMWRTLSWYDQLVRGNQAVRTALTDTRCTEQRSCAAFDEAFARYTSLICLRPGASEGYAFRGFVEVARGQYDEARQDLYSALLVAQGTPPQSSSACPTSRLPVFANQRVLPLRDLAGLRANLAAASVLTARQQSQSQTAAPFFQEAVNHLVYAIDESGPATTTPLASILTKPAEEQCAAAAQSLNNMRLYKEQAVFVVQLADTCYSNAFSRIRNTPQLALSPEHTTVWLDLQAAVALYERISEAFPVQIQRQAGRGKAAVWLILSQLSKPADVQSPDLDPQTYLLLSNRSYADPLLLDAQDQRRNESVYAGQAWTSLLLGAWDTADLSLQRLEQIAPENATYPALRGLVAWLNSTRYTNGSTEYQSAYQQHIQQSLAFYERVAALSVKERSRVRATRSVLFYNLRLTQRGPQYNPEDYGYWMQLAINEMNQALLLAHDEGLSETDQVGYRYWRGRLSFSLAYTWQRKVRGIYKWSELAPLYSQALDDFTRGATYDATNNRRANYVDMRIPWAQTMLSTAVHMQQAEQAIGNGDYVAARQELALVQPLLSATQKRQWDEFAEPRPEYSLLHGLVFLALNQPADFINPLVSGEQSAEASYAQALQDIEDSDFVSSELRPEIYRTALDRLDQVLGSGKLNPQTRAAALRIRTQLLDALK